MKKTTLIIFTFFTAISITFAGKNKINVNEGFYDTYNVNGKKILNAMNLEDYLKDVPSSLEIFKTSKKFYYTSMIIGAAGGGLVGWPVGTAMGGGEANWNLAYAGAGLIVISYYFSFTAEYRIRDAVGEYNKDEKVSFLDRINFNITPFGASLAYHF